ERIVGARRRRDVGVVGATLERRDGAAPALQLVGEPAGPAEERLPLRAARRIARQRVGGIEEAVDRAAERRLVELVQHACERGELVPDRTLLPAVGLGPEQATLEERIEDLPNGRD